MFLSGLQFSPSFSLYPSSSFQVCTRAPFYLHNVVIPEVKPHGFDFADVGEVAVDARAVETDKDPQLVGCPVGICRHGVGVEW